MGMHKLMTDFHSQEDVRFMCRTGELIRSGMPTRTVAALILEKPLDVGEPWEEGEE